MKNFYDDYNKSIDEDTWYAPLL